MKKAISVLLTLLLLVAALSVAASAATSGSCGANVTWTLSGGTLTVSGSGPMQDYEMGKDVPWYENRESITSVVIKSGVTAIGDLAFFSCENLSSVSIPNSVTSIGTGAFWGCNSLANVTIPSGVSTIYPSTFFNSGLTSVSIPSGVTSIGDSAFGMLYSLKTVTLPVSLTTISAYAFAYCTALTDVYFLGSVSDWNEISIGDSNDPLLNAARHYNSTPSAPSVPTGVTAKASGNREITVSWNKSTSATQYNIYRFNGTEGRYIYKGTSYGMSFRDTNLNAGTTYYYKVVAVNKTNGTLVSEKSAAASAKAVAAPAAPTGVTVKATAAKTLTVSYNAVSNATQYNIYRYNGTKKEYVYKGTSYGTSWADKTVSGGTTYYYKVVAVIKNNNCTVVGPMSAAANAKALAIPSVPQNVTAKPSADKTLTVRWDAVPGATQYNIYRYNGAKKEYVYKATAYDTSFTDKNLSKGTTYYYKVVAVTKADGLTLVSERSAAASAKSLAAPNAPTLFAASLGAGSVTLNWSECPDATQYNIYRYNGAKKEYVYKGTSYSLTYLDKTVVSGTTYYYKVVAVTKTADVTLVSAMSAAANAKAV